LNINNVTNDRSENSWTSPTSELNDCTACA